ncbi:hypothetical protein AAZX31_18G219400 [Glycine max]
MLLFDLLAQEKQWLQRLWQLKPEEKQYPNSDTDEDVLQIFFKERELNGDFISRASDLLWRRDFRSSGDYDISELTDNTSQQIEQIIETDSDGGLLKLTRTQEWLTGDNSPPINKKVTAKALQDSSARRMKLNMLKYESLKRELLLLSVGIGLACSGYCLVIFSVQLMCKIQFIISSYFGSEVYQNEVNEYNFFGFSNFEQQIALMSFLTWSVQCVEWSIDRLPQLLGWKLILFVAATLYDFTFSYYLCNELHMPV